MAERLRRMSDAELGAALTALAPDLAFPEPPANLAAVVAGRLEGVRRPAGRRLEGVRRRLGGLLPPRGLRRALVVALLVVALTAIAAGASYFGVRGIEIVFQNGGGTSPIASGGSPGPSTSPSLPASPTLPGLGDRLELGDPSSLAAARAAVGFPVAVPPPVAGFGPPAVFLGGDDVVQRVSFVWVREGEPKLLLTEFNADPYQPYIKKVVLGGGHIRTVSVNGEQGYWLFGAPHELDYVDHDGMHFIDHSRLAGNTLVWTRGDVTFRLEGASNLREALRIARATR
ncbi:MAG TPA: hypothetical protein VID47_08625 [Actinomycetota bacterium]